jgi:hypothetical protein
MPGGREKNSRWEVVRGEETAGARGLGEVGDDGTTVATLHALVAETSTRLAGRAWGADGHAESLYNTCE